MIIGGGVVVVVILVAVAMNMGGEPPPKRQDAPVKEAEKVSDPKPAPVKARSQNYSAKRLKDPDTPAPAIAADVLTEVDALYAKAKKLDLDARRAQKAGDGDKFNKLINDSWDTLLELEERITLYTNWLEEANMDDWRVPTAYGPLQRRITKVDKLKGLIKRVKPNRR
jgi:hypothetical protein